MSKTKDSLKLMSFFPKIKLEEKRLLVSFLLHGRFGKGSAFHKGRFGRIFATQKRKGTPFNIPGGIAK